MSLENLQRMEASLGIHSNWGRRLPLVKLEIDALSSHWRA